MIAKHNYLLHKTQDKILTEQEFEDIPQEYERQIINRRLYSFSSQSYTQPVYNLYL